VLVPGVGAFFFKPFHDIAQRFEILQALSATLAVENDDGHAPETLARDAPIRALLDHLVHAVFAPRGNPFDAVDFFERFLAQGFFFSVSGLVHFDEPLLGGAKDYRIVAAPAMRVAVLVIIDVKEGLPRSKKLDDDGVRCKNIFAFVFGQAFCVDALVIEWGVDWESIFEANYVVFNAVTRCCMNNPTARIQSHVLPTEALNYRILEWRFKTKQEWVLKWLILEISACV